MWRFLLVYLVIAVAVIAFIAIKIIDRPGTSKHADKPAAPSTGAHEPDFIDFSTVQTKGFDFAKHAGERFESNAIVNWSRNQGEWSEINVITENHLQIQLWSSNHDFHAPQNTARVRIRFNLEGANGARGRLLAWKHRKD